jgi:predicted secreted protein
MKALLFALALTFAGVTLTATEPEKVNITKASYDTAELKRNLKSAKAEIVEAGDQTATFKVILDKDGTVVDITYTHNITSMKEEKVDACIGKAYAALLNTTFFPAKKDGQHVEDTLTVQVRFDN